MEKKVRRYASYEERVKRTNRFMVYGTAIVNIVAIIAIFLNKGQMTERYPILPYILIGMVAVGTVLSFVFSYFLLIKPNSTKIFMLSYAFVVYILEVLLTPNVAVGFMIFSLLFTSILYYSPKLTLIFSVLVQIELLVRLIVLYNVTDDMTSFQKTTYNFEFILGIILEIAVCAVCYLINLYNKDILGALQDKQIEQKNLLDKVLDIGKNVNDGTNEVQKLVMELEKSSSEVEMAINEITLGMQSNCENIEQQTMMTGNIHSAIENTAEKSQNVVSISKKVVNTVDEGIQLMQELQNHSDVIATTNESVVEAMNKLQDTANQMKTFAEMIFDISTQTNLLALNASIESARAGEAGRGFAVVADQIRLLADQTRQSTENIKTLIDELSEQTENTAKVINSSVNSTAKQVKVISKASDNFKDVDEGINELQTDVIDISNKINELLQSNNAIIDSISQLSAVNEEVTVNSESVLEIAGSNKEHALSAKELLVKVVNNSNQLVEQGEE